MTASVEQPRFEQRGEILIVGLNKSYTFETRSNIPAQWDWLMSIIEEIPGRRGSAFYGVCWNFHSEIGFDYLAGVEVEAIPESPDLTHLRLSPQSYVVFTHREHVAKLPESFDTAWGWLRENNYEVVDAPSFECYTDAFDANTGLGGVEIWIPVKS